MKRSVIFYIMVLACLLPVMLLRDFTPANELRYVSIADEAIRQGHLFAFTNHGIAYADKPPLFLWLVMLIRLAPSFLQHFLLSLLSVVPAFVSTEIIICLLRLTDKRALVARLVMLSTALMLASMLTLRMDMLMCMFILLAIRQFYKLYSSGKPHESLLLPAYIFLAVFTKGGLGLVIPLAIIVAFLALNKHLSDFFRYMGWRSWLLLLSLFALWFTAVGIEGGYDYLYNLVFHQTFGRAFHAFHHRQPIYYYLYMVWPLLMPWTFWVVLSLWRACKKWATLPDHQKLMIVGSLTSFVILSFVSAKLSIYLLPFVPFAIGSIATENVNQVDTLKKWALAVPCIILALTLPCYIIATQIMPTMQLADTPWLWLTALIFTISATIALFYLFRRHLQRAVLYLSSGIMIATMTAGFSFIHLNSLIGYEQLCNTAINISEQYECNSFVAMGLKHAANMDVYLHQEPQEADDKESIQDLHHVIVMASPQQATGLKMKGVRLIGNHVVGYLP